MLPCAVPRGVLAEVVAGLQGEVPALPHRAVAELGVPGVKLALRAPRSRYRTNGLAASTLMPLGCCSSSLKPFLFPCGCSRSFRGLLCKHQRVLCISSFSYFWSIFERFLRCFLVSAGYQRNVLADLSREKLANSSRSLSRKQRGPGEGSFMLAQARTSKKREIYLLTILFWFFGRTSWFNFA